MSAKKAPLRSRSASKKEQLQKSILGGISIDTVEEETDYASMFSADLKLEKEPSTETAVDISKLRPAPSDWNFYSPLPDHKMYEMIESIENIGLQNRIIVWEEANRENYIILSGHNRFRAFEMIYNTTKDDKYKYIPARVYRHEDITVTEAKEIIVDTNWVQRSLKPSERAQSIAAKINLINERKTYTKGLGRTRDLVAERYGIKGRMVENYRKLIDLNQNFIEMVNNRELYIVSGAKLAVFSNEMQQWIFDNFYSKLENSLIAKLRKGMTKEEIAEVFNSKQEKESDTTRINIEIPYGLEKKFSEFFKQWTEENNLTNRDFKIFIK